MRNSIWWRVRAPRSKSEQRWDLEGKGQDLRLHVRNRWRSNIGDVRLLAQAESRWSHSRIHLYILPYWSLMRLKGAQCGEAWGTTESCGWMLNTWHLVSLSGTQNKMLFHFGGCITMRFLMRSWSWLFVVLPKSISGDVISRVRNNNLRRCWVHFIPNNIVFFCQEWDITFHFCC